MKSISINFIVPVGWHELSDKQLRYVYQLIASEHTDDEIKTLFLLKWSGTKVVGKQVNLEVIAKRFACKEHTAENGITKKIFLPIGRSCFAVARHIIDECYDLERTMGNLANYFDFEAFGRELFMWDYNMGPNGNVFRRS